MHKIKDISLVLIVTISILLASCGTTKQSQTVEEEIVEQSVKIETFNDVEAVVEDAQESVWDEIYRKAKEAEEKKKQIAAALEEAERLEAEKNKEIEELPEEIIEEELDITDVPVIGDITEEITEEESEEEISEEILIQEEKEQVRILDAEKEDESELTAWTILKVENDAFEIEKEPETELKERDIATDRILYGNPDEAAIESVSALSSGEEKIETEGVKVVNIYLPAEEKVEESQITAEEILALGSKYESKRHQQQIADMGYEEIAGKILKFLDEVWPIVVVVVSLIIVIVLFVILGKKIINPRAKKKTEDEEELGVELPSEGVVVVRPGAEEGEEFPIEKELLEKGLNTWKPKVDTEEELIPD